MPTLDDYAAFLGGRGDHQIAAQLFDPQSEASRYFAALQVTAAAVPEIDWLAIVSACEGPMLNSGEAADCIAKRLAESNRPIHRADIRQLLDEAWQELSRPLRLWFLTTFAEMVLDAMAPETKGNPLQTQDTLSMAEAGTHLTAESAAVDPGTALDVLQNVSSNQSLVYLLSKVSGRTPDELAELLERPRDQIEHFLALADLTLTEYLAEQQGHARPR